MACPRRRRLEHRRREPLARGDAELPRDQVEAGHQLGHAVLDLEPGVHLQEVVVAGGIEQELDGRGVVEVDGAAPPGARSRAAPRGSPRSTAGEGDSSTSFWWRRWTEQSRSPSAARPPCRSPSSWTSTWRPGRRGARRRPCRRRRRSRLAPGGGQRGRQLSGVVDAAHAPSPAARGGLQHARAARSARCASAASGRPSSGHHRARARRGRPRRPPTRRAASLLPSDSMRRRRRPDEDESRRLDRAREAGVLRQEPVAGMDRLGTAARAASIRRRSRGTTRRRRRRRCARRRSAARTWSASRVGVGVDRDRSRCPARGRRA